MIDTISVARGISAGDLNRIADSLSIQTAEDAIKYKFADSLLYTDQYITLLKKKVGVESKDNVSYVTLEKYTDVPGSFKAGSKGERIAVIFAQGDIVDGQGDAQSIGGDAYAKAIRKAREDKKVKAIVLRVNSGGGSALASDVILREVFLANKEKPVVASFGDVAASGGYYIACGARMILADPTTITGSIGVWAAIPNFKGLLNNKLGVTFDRANTNKNADFISVTDALPPYQVAVLQNDINHIYDVFITHVAQGRDMTKAQVDSIGQGRIWSGIDAKRLGLIDGFGGLRAAIDSAARLAGITEYSLLPLPEQKDPITQIIDDLMGNSTQTALEKELGENYRYYEYFKQMQEIKGVQARLPFMITLN
jgi:protease IV